MKPNVKVSVVQMDVAWLDPEENLNRMKRLLEQAVDEEHPDLVVFPELCYAGYIKGRSSVFGPKYLSVSDVIPGRATQFIGNLAAQYGVYVIFGINELHPTLPGVLYNSAVLIGADGELIGVHHKMHIPGDEKHYFVPGETSEVFNTELGKIGIQICYDGLFPEISRVLTLKGAEIICNVWAASETPDKTVSLSNIPSMIGMITQTRAVENKIYFVSANRVGVQEDKTFKGGSCIADPFGNLLNNPVPEIEKEGIVSAILKSEEIFAARSVMAIFRDRRPEMYQEIVQPMALQYHNLSVFRSVSQSQPGTKQKPLAEGTMEVITN